MTISAFIPVYNEEERIEYTLQSFKWCDEIFILDKSSTDNTVKICKKFGATIKVIENSDTYSSSEFDYIKECKGDWVMIVTASDIIDKSLALEVKRLLNNSSPEVNAYRLPFKQYILGICDKHSGWDYKYRGGPIRKNYLEYNSDVHNAIKFPKNKVVNISPKYGYFYHLTHVTVDMMMERHIRYWRGEGYYFSEHNLYPAFKNVLSTIKSLVKRNAFLSGWDCLALALAFLSNSFMTFVYKWETTRKGKAADIYKKMRMENFKAWSNE